MARSRLQFQAILEDFFPEPQAGEDKPVYFQPTNNTELEYPCIIYDIDDAETEFADNVPYTYTERYSVTVLDRDPDSEYRKKVAGLPMSRFNRYYASDNLNHYVYNIYF